MDVKDIHPQNASLTVVVKDLGNKIFVNEIQFPYIAAVDYQQLADNTVEKSCVFDTRD